MDNIEVDSSKNETILNDKNNKINDQSQNVFTSIVNEVFSQRSLLVLSKGMRSPNLMAQLISKYAKERENSLTLLLNFKKEEVPSINEQLHALKIGKYKIHPITNETTTKRSMLYISGGIYTITNVILVMDLLQQAISPTIITTIILNEAEKIDNVLSDEAWIATMIRRDNKNVKTLAITDNIEVLASYQGFRKVMQSLYLEYCSVWPLSRYEILKDFTDHPDFQTYENHIKLPAPIKKLQKAIMSVTRSCIEEFNRRFKERNKGDDVINEQDVFNTSLNIVYYKMKAIAGRFNLHGQQLLRDIFEFRMLLLHLIYYDAVEFYLKVLSLKNNANFESIWYIGDRRTMEYIEELLQLTKQRVFKVKREIILEEKSNKKIICQGSGNMFEQGLIENLDSLTNTVLFSAPEDLKENEDDLNDNLNKGEEENNLMDIVKNPITYKGKTYRLDLKININFKYKALIEILKKITTQSTSLGNLQKKKLPKKIIWIWVQEDKKVERIKDLLTSFFSKKDEHKIKLLLRLHALLNEMGIDKKDPSVSLMEEDDDEEMPKNGKMKKKGKGSDDDVEKYIFKKLNQDLIHLKKEYDNKIMINLFNTDNSNAEQSSASQNTQQNNQPTEEVSGNKLITMLKPKSLKRKFYDIESDNEEEKKGEILQPIEEENQIKLEKEKESESLKNNENNITDQDFDWNLLEEEIGEQKKTSTKRVLTYKLENEIDKQRRYEYSILNSEKIDLNSFYSYNDQGHVIFDSELISGYKILVNALGSTSERMSFINKIQPDIVVLFEPQLSLIREIMLEKRCSKYGGDKCNISEVHILMVQNSIESAIYLDNVRKENSAFVTLLNDRSSLPILDDNPESRIKKIIYQKNISTRIGRGIGHSASLNNRPIIIVDKREFNSPVPTKLYHDGFWIIPILLEKGDYVLSNSIVIERKCVETGDLLNSFRSGRLENQIKNLCASYSRPMLLIEFSEGVDFSLESAEINRLQHNINWVNDFESDKTEINKSNVKYGLSLLCVKYPKLTILWSKSPEYTSKLFQKLREHNPDPNPREFAKYQEESEKNNESDPFARHATDIAEKTDLINLPDQENVN